MRWFYSEDADLFPVDLTGMAKQGARNASLGCVTCHTQQVRRVETGFDVERGWGKRPSVPRLCFQDHVLLGNSRIGPDLANLGLRVFGRVASSALIRATIDHSIFPVPT